MSISDYLEAAWLNTIRGDASGTSFTAVAHVYAKLHTGDPGEAGTSNAATNTSRQEAKFAAASGGSMASNADVTWTSVSTTETYSHISLWDASSAGNCLGSGALAASKSVTAGDTFTIASGSLTWALD